MSKWISNAVLAALLATQAWAGHVEWSDGQRREGTLLAGPNGTVRLHDGTRVREWPLERVARVVFRTEKERLERAWRFVEAGQTRKEEWGDPFPVAELVAELNDLVPEDEGQAKRHRPGDNHSFDGPELEETLHESKQDAHAVRHRVLA